MTDFPFTIPDGYLVCVIAYKRGEDIGTGRKALLQKSGGRWLDITTGEPLPEGTVVTVVAI